MADFVKQQAPQPVEITLQNIYFNGFQLGLSNADINGLLVLNGTPQVGISMSYTTAKTLATQLNELIHTLESVTKHKIMTTEEVGQGIEKLNQEQAKGSKDDVTH